MTNFASRIAGVATLALAALPFCALATNAAAAPVAVKVSDLDLNSRHGQAAFDARAGRAATEFCRSIGYGTAQISQTMRCKAAVRAELAEKAAPVRQAQLRANTYAAR